MSVSANSPREIEEEESQTFGSETSTITSDSERHETTKDDVKHEAHHKEKSIPEAKNYKKRTVKFNFNEEDIIRMRKVDSAARKSSPSTTSSPPKPHLVRNKNCSNGARVFHNLLTCRAVDTDDSVVVNAKSKPKYTRTSDGDHVENADSSEICRRDNKIRGSPKILRNSSCCAQQQWNCRACFDGVKGSTKDELKDQLAHKIVNWPNCSQCGKPFKPERLHTHMKSCKGMKALSRERIDKI